MNQSLPSIKYTLRGAVFGYLPGRAYPLRIPLPAEEKGWKPYPIFSGSTPNLESLSCHVSVLTQGHCPHPPHKHREEEILLLLTGEVDLTLPGAPARTGAGRTRLRPGQFVYYPADFAHTLTTASAEPANYLMFKWHNGVAAATKPLAFDRFDAADTLENSEIPQGFRWHLVFEGPTAWLRKLQCHVSTLTPGAGYESHIDAHDVAIVVLEGEVATLNERARPHSVIFYPAGEPHGMYNSGSSTAKYIVFEFHGDQLAAEDAFRRRVLNLLAKVRDPDRWKRKLRRLMRNRG